VMVKSPTWRSVVVLTVVWAVEAAAVEVADALGDHMVLQRGKAVPIWGTAEAGEKVTVAFAGQTRSLTGDATGHWLVRLGPFEASTTPRELTVKAPSGTVVLKDVLVGDVWICGGQSNMGRDVRRSWRPDDQRMDYPHIRFLPVRSRGSKYPQDKLEPPPPPKSRRGERVTESNVWHRCTETTTPECCAVGFFFAERIYKETGIAQGLLWNAWAGSTAREWIPQPGWSLRPELAGTATLVDSWYPSTPTGRAAYKQAVDDIDAWRKRAAEAVEQGHPFPFPQPKLPEPDDSQGRGRGTTILYNGRVHPLVPYAIAGILWYQGESDCRNRGYVPQIEAMAESWRTLFAAPGEKPANLPFYFVQMQRCGSYMSPEIRDQQFQSYFTIPNAGMAVLLDLDMNLHPNNKYDSGRRLALWALAKVYGKDVVYSGPLYKSRRVEGGKVVVEFAHTHGSLFIGRKDKLAPPVALPDGKLVNLEITADGRQWVPAQSRIEGKTLVVWADGVAKPTDVRYCWKSKADEPFLYNKAGLPAAQFNTTTDYSPKRKPTAPPEAKPRSEARRPAAPAEAMPSSVFGEGCVLQRDAKVPVWGTAEPGDKVTVSFAGQTKTANAERFGRWRVELDPMAASAEGRPLTVEGPRNTFTVPTVYVGDVWLYLSQSWHLGGPKELRVDEKTLPPICTSGGASVWEHQNHARRPQEREAKGARWAVYKKPGRYYRNDAYYLGLGLARVTRVPVGILGQGASTLGSMTPPEGFRAFEKELGEPAAAVVTWLPNTPRGKRAYLDTLAAIGDWVGKTRATLNREDVTFRDLSQPPALPGPPEYERGPTTMYNAIVHRFVPAAFRGIIIQPKTFSVGDPQYLVKAKALIHGLRTVCGRDDLPVCFVQIHSPGRYELDDAKDPADWVRLRAAQNQLARLPGVTVLATYDLKQPGRSDPDVGLRVAQWAAALVNASPVLTGPTYKSHRTDGKSLVVEFTGVGGGLKAETPLGGFQLAGDDGNWHDATATIEGNTVRVTSDKVDEPVAVRYAWTPEPTGASLYNRDGFPALPFASR